jgi:hypothetical protein
MKLSIDLIPSFVHKAPQNYSYEVEEFKKNVFSIWLRDHRTYDYNNGKSVRCIWGFYNYKKCKYFAPVNSSTIGKEVDFEQTRDYTSMPIKQTILESFFQ